MKQKLKMILAVALICSNAFGQDGWLSAKKGSLVGIHFNLSDPKAPNGIKDPITGNVYSTIPQMDKGLSISYWKGLTNKIDLAVKLNAMSYSGLEQTGNGNSPYGFEFEPTLNIRPIKDAAKIAPFLTGGVGVGMYNKKFGAYVPAGLGAQVNFAGATYMFLQAQYRFSLTTSVFSDNLFYSIGFAQNVGSGRHHAVAKVAAPAPPAAVVAPVVVEKVVEKPKDTDGDGIADVDDKCPNVKGLAKYQGCPIPDTDGDGINDEEDKCPTVAGVARYQGCPIPDTDGDGVNDEEDKCPNQAGPASNHGCPVIAQAVVDKINFAAKNIFFATSSDKLLPESFKSLNDVAAIMHNDKSLKLSIDGYTDNKGDAAKNQSLSEKRAAAVKAYLVSKGIAESSLTSAGHGSDNPAADNATAQGRAKNRRVELKASNN